MICEFINFIANIIIGFFNFILSINFLKILVIIPVYVFIQRVHNQAQQRSLKAVSDEIVKINDFLIEFIFKLNNLKAGDIVDDKTLTELIVLKAKINSHLNYLSEYLYAFPYGGPLNYFIFFCTKKYFSNDAKEKSDALELEYQENILDDTILSLEKNLVNNNKKLLPYSTHNTQKDILFNNDIKKIYKMKNNHIIHLDQKSIDKIISLSTNLISHLEDNTRKML
ncbi:hypothetical protein [Acinetobacter silvestris]|uniref:Uncharacterized protein n=1 Tax=Acinetobacter silvestris TaxID=1977882 RepID=A0A1Y3CHT4_9GAMM|nr:hypothetical protein [Acinetobacter silvestris]OTG65938.1 hypothetical protein B9T28_06995 [Acinetobacter silvestris]